MDGGREVPLGINATMGAVVVVVLCAVPSSITGPEIDARLAVVALGLAAFAAAVVDVPAAAISVSVAFLLFDGFVEGNHGDLVWHGRADLTRLGVLGLAAGLGLLIGALRQRGHRRTARSSTSASMVPSHHATSGSRSEATLSTVSVTASHGPIPKPRGASGAREVSTWAPQD